MFRFQPIKMKSLKFYEWIAANQKKLRFGHDQSETASLPEAWVFLFLQIQFVTFFCVYILCHGQLIKYMYILKVFVKICVYVLKRFQNKKNVKLGIVFVLCD